MPTRLLLRIPKMGYTCMNGLGSPQKDFKYPNQRIVAMPFAFPVRLPTIIGQAPFTLVSHCNGILQTETPTGNKNKSVNDRSKFLDYCFKKCRIFTTPKKIVICVLRLTSYVNPKLSAMKAVLFFVVIILFSFHLFAQDRNEMERRQMNSSIIKENTRTITTVNYFKKRKLDVERSKDVTMRNGKMLVVQNGKSSLMRSNVTMRNGTIVMPSGLIFLTDFGGSIFMMHNGMYIDRYGKIKYPTTYYKETYQR